MSRRGVTLDDGDLVVRHPWRQHVADAGAVIPGDPEAAGNPATTPLRVVRTRG
jgi:hypothetical protein